MSWIAVDLDGEEQIHELCPMRDSLLGFWHWSGERVSVPAGTSFKLIGKQLTWGDEPVELEEQNEQTT